MKKVLVVMPSLYNGGAERSLVNLLNEFPENKYKIDVLLFKREGIFLKQLPKNINVLKTPYDLKKLYGNFKENGLWIFYKIISKVISKIFTKNTREERGFRWKYFYGQRIKKLEGKYDVAIAYISGEVLYYVDEKVNADKKIVWIHNDYNSAQHPKKYDYKHLKNMSNIVSISDSCVNILKEEFPEFKDRIVMLENITSSKVLEEKAKEFYPQEYDKKEYNFLSIGRLHPQKGFDMAIEAAYLLKQKGIRFKWFVIGNGELEDKLRNKIKEKKLENEFILLGIRENPYPYIKNCTLFIQTSLYEGKSVVLDEAKILNKPIVVTNYPTVKDQIISDKEGIITEIDPNLIAEGISKILVNKNIYQEIENYLKNHEYGNQEEIKKYIELID